MSGDELEMPAEGFVTISIAFTKDQMDRILQAMRKLQAEGWPEPAVLAKIKASVPNFSSVSIKRLYDIAVGRPVPDDFKPQEIVSQHAVAKDTFEIELAANRTDIFPGAVVRFLGTDWYVTKAGKKPEIRRIV